MERHRFEDFPRRFGDVASAEQIDVFEGAQIFEEQFDRPAARHRQRRRVDDDGAFLQDIADFVMAAFLEERLGVFARLVFERAASDRPLRFTEFR
jgi:hypothetical protein